MKKFVFKAEKSRQKFYVILNERESLSHIKNFTAMISLCIPQELFKLNEFFKLEEYPLLIDVIMYPPDIETSIEFTVHESCTSYKGVICLKLISFFPEWCKEYASNYPNSTKLQREIDKFMEESRRGKPKPGCF